MKSHVWRILVLAVLVACTACSNKKDDEPAAGDSAAQEHASLIPSSDEMAITQVKNLGNLVDLIVAEAAEIPRAEFDPSVLASKLGKDPRAHFEWVRDHTWWAPYRGLLRGSTGVMLDRVGSSLDRAVLLGDLLRRSGHEVRLAHAEMSESRAREILDQVRPIPDRRRGVVAPRALSVERQRAMEVIVPGNEKLMQERLASSKRRGAEAQALVRSQVRSLFDLVKDVAARGSQGETRSIAALRDHWWVELEQHGRWIALDVLLPDAVMGNALLNAKRTSDWKMGAEWPSIPDGDWHAVQLSVVVERFQEGATMESTVLETVLHPAETLGRPITLAHKATPWPDGFPDPSEDPNALGNAAVNVREWVPFLRIGDDFVVQSGFTDTGELIVGPLDPQRDIAAVGGGGFMSGFGEALGGGDAAASSMTAEWIDYELRVPGESPQRLRRPVFDLLGPAARAAKTEEFDASSNERLIDRYEALLSKTDILLQPCDLTSEFVAHLMSSGIIANASSLRKLSQERDSSKAQHLAATILRKMHRWGPLPHLALWRSALVDTASDSFISKPNVLNYRFSRRAVDADREAFREMIDLAANGTEVRRNATRDPFEVRLQQGVADTVAEIMALGDELHTANNTAAVMATAGEGNPVMVLGPRDSKELRNHGWTDDVVARLKFNLDAGFLVVVSKEPVLRDDGQRVAWWRIDPVTGETVGVMDTGFHADDAEYTGATTGAQAQRQRLSEWFLDPQRQRDYETLRSMAQTDSFQMSAADVADYNMYCAVDAAIRSLWLAASLGWIA